MDFILCCVVCCVARACAHNASQRIASQEHKMRFRLETVASASSPADSAVRRADPQAIPFATARPPRSFIEEKAAVRRVLVLINCIT